jgi:hypothetical protein
VASTLPIAVDDEQMLALPDRETVACTCTCSALLWFSIPVRLLASSCSCPIWLECLICCHPSVRGRAPSITRGHNGALRPPLLTWNDNWVMGSQLLRAEDITDFRPLPWSRDISECHSLSWPILTAHSHQSQSCMGFLNPFNF